MFVRTRDLQANFVIKCLDSLADTCNYIYVLSSGNIFQFKENPNNGTTHHSTKTTFLQATSFNSKKTPTMVQHITQLKTPA